MLRRRLLKYLLYFQDMWAQFGQLDKDKDGRLNIDEFKAGCAAVGLSIPDQEAEAEFKKCDADGGGVILFAEFCTWCCHRSVGTDPLAKEAEEDALRGRCAEEVREWLLRMEKGDYTADVVKAFKKADYEPHKWVDELDALQEEGILDQFLENCLKKGKKEAKGAKKKKTGPAAAKPAPPTLTMPDKAGRAALFGECDVNGNGGLSLAEIDKAIHEGTIGRAMNCPDFDHKPAIMRAYKAADTSGDELIERSEFYKLLKYLVYFNNLWLKFEEIDSDHDRRMDIDEFAKGCEIIGVTLSAEEAAAEFHKCAADGGSHILFGEFCTWCAKRHTLDLEMTGARVEAAAAAGRAEAEAAEAADAAGGDFEGSLDIYLASGKKKHARYFWLEGTKLCWDKERKTGKAGKTRRKSGKSEQLIAVNGALEIKSAKEWFQQIDANNSGQLDADELAELYKLARGEKLKYKDLSKAMAEMDSDGSGTCDLEEFERWWSANGK